jgi:hypothetical protein
MHQTPRFWNNFTCGWSFTAKSMAEERKSPRITSTRSDKREAWVPLGRGGVSQCVGFLESDFFRVYKDEGMSRFKTRSRRRLMATTPPLRSFFCSGTEVANRPYAEPDEFSPNSYYLFKIRFNIIPARTPRILN